MFSSMMVLMMICYDFALFHYYSDGDVYLSRNFSRVNLYLIDLLGHSVVDCQSPMVWWLVNFVAKQVDYFYWYYCYRCCQRCPPLQPAVATITTTLWTKLNGMYKCTFFYEEITVCVSECVSRMKWKKICVRRWGDTQTHTHVHTTERRRQSYTRCESLRWRKREKERQTKQIRMWWHRCEWEKCVYVCSKCQNRIERARATKPYNTITQLANKYYDVYTFDSSLLRLRCRERVTRVCSPFCLTHSSYT